MGFPGVTMLALLFAASVQAQAPFLERMPGQSSDLASVGSDERRRLLGIEFHSGGIYRYLDEPKETYDALLAAGSRGRFFASGICSRFNYERVKPRSSAAR
jgi:hypothetical protein